LIKEYKLDLISQLSSTSAEIIFFKPPANDAGNADVIIEEMEMNLILQR
jgi:hypothetical protein